MKIIRRGRKEKGGGGVGGVNKQHHNSYWPASSFVRLHKDLKQQPDPQSNTIPGTTQHNTSLLLGFQVVTAAASRPRQLLRRELRARHASI